MLVKKEMWRVYTCEITNAPKQFPVIWDIDKEEVMLYDIKDYDGDNWVKVDEGELFYESEELAEAGRQHIINDFLSKVTEIRLYCDMFYHSLEYDDTGCNYLFKGLTLPDVFGFVGTIIK